jgi:NADP-reducing hydrogenase subunit HndD
MDDKQKMIINGNELEFEQDETILSVARRNHIDIPTLCYLKGTTPTGACRICVVEVAGARTLLPSCSTPAANNMVVKTESPKVIQARREILNLMLSSGCHNCSIGSTGDKGWTAFQLDTQHYQGMTELCPVWGDCQLQDLAYRYQVFGTSHPATETLYPKETDNPFIIRDFSRCILCGRCVQACTEIQVNNAIHFGYRGAFAKIIAKSDQPLKDSDCVFCGECVQVCPVGALFEKKALGKGRASEMEKIRTTCPYCGVGCQLWLHVKDEKIVKVTGVEEAEPNHGRLCVKGRFGYDFIYSKDRLSSPMIKENGSFRKASWDEALHLVATKFKDIIAKHGSDALAGVSCARSINEDSYAMQKLFRGVFKTNNIDHCART